MSMLRVGLSLWAASKLNRRFWPAAILKASEQWPEPAVPGGQPPLGF